MLRTIKKIFVAGSLVLAAALIATNATAQNGARTFTLVNHSRYQINHLYVSPVGGPIDSGDKLGSHVFPPNYRVDLSVDPGWYHVILMDQDRDVCILENVDFRDSKSWTITDEWLVKCEGRSNKRISELGIQ
jgi:hypothetical protein